MKKQDLMEIKQLDVVSLLKKSKAIKEEITGLVMDKNRNQLKDLKGVAKKRKDLAQILTVMKQKEETK